MADDDNVLDRFSYSGAFQAYAASWLFNFLVAMAGAIIANGVFAVPLYQVVNVNLSIACFVAIVLLALYGVGFLAGIFTGQFGVLSVVLFGSLLAILIPFAPIAAYQIYAWLGGLSIASQSFVYDDFMATFSSSAKTIASWLGQLSVQQPAEGTLGRPVDLVFGLRVEMLAQVATIGGFILALFRFLFGGTTSSLVRAD
jgi:hypothetical protein